jgi:TolA-binding protein
LIKLFISIFVLLVSVSNAETSMFGAGDLDSSTPYGLTKTEKVIVKNKKIVKKTEESLKRTDTKLKDLSESFDGVTSLIESESLKLNKVFISLNKHIDNFKIFTQTSNVEINKNTEMIINTQQSIDLDMKKLKSKIIQNENNIKKLKNSFDKIVELTNNINNNYVTKKEFDKLISLLDKESTQKVSPDPTKTLEVKSSRELLAEAKELFKIDYFTKAKVIFEGLITAHYRPAESNFYIGEINYYRKNYEDALYFFKRSMTLYDKAEYLPKLLLHSAVSFEELGDIKNANNFYSTIIDIYPESHEAKEASKKINYKDN